MISSLAKVILSAEVIYARGLLKVEVEIMNRKHDELFKDRSHEEFCQILNICQITEKTEYSKNEESIIKECLKYLEEGKNEVQSSYLIRVKQKKAKLPINQGEISFEELLNLSLSDESLTDEQLAEILEAVKLERKEHYLFEEADSFRESYQLWMNEQTTFTLIDLKKAASNEIPVSKLIKILPWCGLKEEDNYSQQELETFTECWKMVRGGKTLGEIQKHFGTFQTGSEEGLEQILDSLNDIAQNQKKAAFEVVASKAVRQRREIEQAYDLISQRAIVQGFASGELHEIIDAQIEENIGVQKKPTLTLMRMLEAEENPQTLLLPSAKSKPT